MLRTPINVTNGRGAEKIIEIPIVNKYLAYLSPVSKLLLIFIRGESLLNFLLRIMLFGLFNSASSGKLD